MSSDESPSAYDQARKDSIAHFKTEARRAFGDICARYGLKEDAVAAADEGNDFAVLFANHKLRVLVEGINWGDNATVSLGANHPDARQYSVWQFMNERPPPSPVAGTQIQQLYGFARYLEGHASDVLAGDRHFFAVLDRKAENQRNVVAAEREAAARVKRRHGYVEVVSPFGSTIWRRPRAAGLPDSISVTELHPGAMVWRLRDLLPTPIAPPESPTVVAAWLKDVGTEVRPHEALGELSTEKATIEVNAPGAGTILWLALEGEAIEPATVLIVVLPHDG